MRAILLQFLQCINLKVSFYPYKLSCSLPNGCNFEARTNKLLVAGLLNECLSWIFNFQQFLCSNLLEKKKVKDGVYSGAGKLARSQLT